MFRSSSKIHWRKSLVALSIWLAILSLLATIHADVFEQEDHPLRAIIASPFERIFLPNLHPVKLSTLLSAQEARTDGDIKQDSPLYIFMIDLSLSMLEQQGSNQGVAQ